MGPKSMYRMSHESNNQKLSILFRSNFDLTCEGARETGEDLSHFPHRDRRSFMYKIHELYQETKCLSRIIEQLSLTTYYQFIRQRGFAIDSIVLSVETEPAHIEYQLYLNTLE